MAMSVYAFRTEATGALGVGTADLAAAALRLGGLAKDISLDISPGQGVAGVRPLSVAETFSERSHL